MPRRRRVEHVQFRWLVRNGMFSKTAATTQSGDLNSTGLILPNSGRIERILGSVCWTSNIQGAAGFVNFALLGKVSDDSIGAGEFSEAFSNPTSEYTNRSDDFPLWVPLTIPAAFSAGNAPYHHMNFDQRAKRKYDTGSLFYIGACFQGVGSFGSTKTYDVDIMYVSLCRFN